VCVCVCVCVCVLPISLAFLPNCTSNNCTFSRVRIRLSFIPQNRNMTSPWSDFIAGTLGGGLGVITGHPIDTIKVRVQVSQGKLSAMRCFRATLQREGMRGLYRGITPPLLFDCAQNAVLFASYGIVSRWLLEGRRRQEGDQITLPLSHVFVAGCLAGIPTAGVICPIDLIKSRLQVQGTTGGATALRGPLQAVSSAVRVGGVASLFTGLGATLARDVPSFGVYFLSYEAIKRTAAERDLPTTVTQVLGGGVAGMVAWAVTYPIDVVKTIVQTHGVLHPTEPPLGMLPCATANYQRHGLRFFFHGCLPTLFRAFPVNASVFLGYELTSSFLKS